MSHHITAVVTDVAGAAALGAPAADLAPRLVIVALTADLVGSLDPARTALWSGWELATDSLVAQLRARIASPFALVETEYFGSGYQRAGAWHGDRVLVEPREAPGVVSAALAALGVVRGDAHDEWEAVGLVRFRSNDDILAAAR